MLGLTPSIFSRGSTPSTRNSMSLATPNIFVYRVGAKDDKNKKSITFLSDIKSHERAKKGKKKQQHYIKSVSEQAEKKKVTKVINKFLCGLCIKPADYEKHGFPQGCGGCTWPQDQLEPVV